MSSYLTSMRARWLRLAFLWMMLPVLALAVLPIPAFSQDSPVETQPQRSNGARGGDVIRRVGEWKYEINRSRLNETLDDTARLARQGRVIPYQRDGQMIGFKIFGLRPNSLPKRLGLLSGDLLLEVNGKQLDSFNRAVTLFGLLRSAEQITLVILRRGEERRLSYLFR